ncbi:MAG: hypothetical protein KatS3mg076_0475 [Candidatus Binatia bacterium]|nr:MAG: hypothetical protein KatS3mg076_0475 [Candidatus Binatia bacterium]
MTDPPGFSISRDGCLVSFFPSDAAELQRSLGSVRAEIASVLERALREIPPTQEEALLLLRHAARHPAPLLTTARLLRDRHKGRTITYSPKVFLPLTNLCRDYCSYCTFRKDPRDPGAWTMLPEEVRDWSRKGKQAGCIEALFCLGDRPERAFREYRETLAVLGHRSTPEYLVAACRIALDEGLLPHTNAGILRKDEMRELKSCNVSLGLMLENASPRLRLPGQAHHHAPDKDPALRVRMIEEAGELRIPFTTGILLGIGETLPERVESLYLLRDLQRSYGHIQEIIVQNFRAKPATRMARAPEPETWEVAATAALCRLLLPDANIQVPPNLNPHDHRLLLAAGINDWGGISPVTLDYVNPEAPWPLVASLARTCAELGYALRPRLPVYPEYLRFPGFVDEPLRRRALELAREKGVAL